MAKSVLHDAIKAAYTYKFTICNCQRTDRNTQTDRTNPTDLNVQNGGGERDRTDDPLRARQVLSQLSYTPIFEMGELMKVVGLDGLEPSTSRLSVVCSSQLSY